MTLHITGHADLLATIEAQRREIAELGADARRYRWLRDAPATSQSEPIRHWLWSRPFGADMGCLDAAIDAAEGGK